MTTRQSSSRFPFCIFVIQSEGIALLMLAAAVLAALVF